MVQAEALMISRFGFGHGEATCALILANSACSPSAASPCKVPQSSGDACPRFRGWTPS